MSTQRARALRVLGITPWRLRGQSASASAAEVVAGPQSLAVALAAVLDGRTARLLERVLQALDPALAAAAKVPLDSAATVTPIAPIYLAFGAAAAQRLAGVGAQIVQLEEPAALFEAAGKRRLWQAWRALRRGQRREADA